MTISKYKVLSTKDYILREEDREELPIFNYDAYLNTRILNSDNSKDLLCESLDESRFRKPSKFDIDYHTAKYDIQLSTEAWKKIAEIDEEPVDMKVVQELKEKMKRLYAES